MITSRLLGRAAYCAFILAVSAGPVLAVTYIQGFDIYSGNGTVNWTTAKNSGYPFAFIKATEGVDFIDSRFTTNMSSATSAGMYVAPYHFCRAESKNGVKFTSYDGRPFAVGSDPWLDATSEAADFIQSIRPWYTSGSYLPPVADIETFPNLGSTSLNKTFVSNWLQLFSDTVNNALGVRPMIYTGKSNANTYFSSAVASSHKLWLAWWKNTGTTSPPLQSDTPSWPAWTFWQWSDGADSIAKSQPVPGTSGNIDRDVFYGTTQQLTALLIHNVPGDYNHDGVVDAADYVVYRNSKGSTVNLAADGNNNQVVDAADYTFWRSHLGQTAGSGTRSGAETAALAQFAAPEPAAVVLLSLGGGIAAAARCGDRRRR
jgi:GH25 family lysozyme M1 (1,4-beta-N-acetylmuramidase)